MWGVGGSASGFLMPTLNVIAYIAAVSACVKGEQWQQALGLLAVMRQAELLPNVILYGVAISACEEGQQWKQALGLLAVIQQFESVISACEEGQQWKQALGHLAVLRQIDSLPAASPTQLPSVPAK